MNKRQILLILVLIAIGGAIYYLDSLRPKNSSPGSGSVRVESRLAAQEKAKKYDAAKEIVHPSGFVNTDPFQIKDLIGKKVILVDFWTYSCINCQRTTPYLNSWYEKYKNEGLEIVGIHSPEFEFEKNIDNVREAVAKFGIAYPVVLDNDYGTWHAYGNRYWPHKYLIDIDGFIAYDHIGEGGYEETETKIQELLRERMAVLDMKGTITMPVGLPSAAPPVDFSKIASPETYFGSKRNENLGNGAQGISGIRTFRTPSAMSSNTLYLDGTWDIQPEFARNLQSGAKITFTYSAKDVYFVAESDSEIPVTVLRDGKPIKEAAGADVAKDGSGKVIMKESRLYKLIQDSSYGEHTIEIIIESPGLRAYTFTFG